MKSLTIYKNVSNYFTDKSLEDLKDSLKEMINSRVDGVFGFEIELVNGEKSYRLVSPPYIRQGTMSKKRVIGSGEDFKYYEGYLSRHYFFPLYMGLNDNFLSMVEAFDCPKETTIVVQWLFKRKEGIRWKEQALEAHRSYIQGVPNPSSSSLGRTIQEKIVGAIDWISRFDTTNNYIEEAEEKMLSDGFQFQLRVAVQGGSAELCSKLNGLLETYDSYNSVRLCSQNKKGVSNEFCSAVLTKDTNDQILCKQEIYSLLGEVTEKPIVKDYVEDPIVEHVIAKNSIEEIKAIKKSTIGSAVQLLPLYERKPIEVDENLPSKIAEALKRVGVISTARVYNESVVAGIRLTIVQFDIPKGKTLTQIKNKEEDIQAALGVSSLTIEQGNEADTLRVVIPNEKPTIVSLRELLEDMMATERKPLSFVVGVDEINNPIYLSLTDLVHLLVAGTTGSGKSVFLNSLIVSLVVMHTPEDLRMYLVDPKQVELQQYSGLAHIEDVVTDMHKASALFSKLVAEMTRRYSLFKETKARNIKMYNAKSTEKLPYIVCVVDEYADLKSTHPEVEDNIARLGQLARAAGIHIVIATQRPSADIISGRVKANILNAISFNLGNSVNYRTVFGTTTPYRELMGRGDGVMKIEGYPKTFQRFQSAIVSPDETQEEKVYESLIEFYKEAKGEPILDMDVPEEVEPTIDEQSLLLVKLKQIIARTKETRVTVLRKEMNIRSEKFTELMNSLVEEKWLVKHKSNSKGYELVATPDMMKDYLES